MKRPIILASASSRRIELLKLCGFEFSSIEANINENIDFSSYPIVVCEQLAQEKALHVFKQYPHAIVIGADTIVKVDEIVLQKPLNKQEACWMLRLLSNRTHQVVTSVCMVSEDNLEVFSSVVEVDMIELDDSMIEKYIDLEQPFDKAGAYAIQGRAACFVKAIRGDYYAVVGLPVVDIYRYLKKFLF